jgi:hypothetical protein
VFEQVACRLDGGGGLAGPLDGLFQDMSLRGRRPGAVGGARDQPAVPERLDGPVDRRPGVLQVVDEVPLVTRAGREESQILVAPLPEFEQVGRGGPSRHVLDRFAEEGT